MGTHEPAVWIGFTLLVGTLLVLDLGVLNRRAHELSIREAAAWSGSLVTIALLFGLFLLWREGGQAATEYYTGYLVELSLSVDNLFVFILIFRYFGVPPQFQPRVLKWGILGAIIMRAIMISLGALLLARFHWIVYVFGVILVLTGFKMLRAGDEEVDPERNPLIRLARRYLPVTDGFVGQAFVVRQGGRWLATPLLMVLLMVEWSDLVFAIDSIPAIFAITRDPFIIYSSNVFAILGLRALFFVLAGAMKAFVYLKPGVAAILVFVGVKMTIMAWYHIPAIVSLAVIVTTLTVAILASVWQNSRRPAAG